MRLILSMLLLLLVFSCQQAQKMSEADKARIIQEVQQMFQHYHEDIKNEGLTAEFQYLDSSDIFFWVPPGYQTALAYEDVRNTLYQSAPGLRSVTFHWDTLQVFPLSHNIATYTGIVGGEMLDTAGLISEVNMIESGTLIKRTDGWKILSGQSRNNQ